MARPSIHGGLLSLSTAATTIVIALAVINSSAYGQGVDTNDPNLPPTFPPAEYRSAPGEVSTYNGPGIQLILRDVFHRPLPVPPPIRTPSGPHEIEDFQSQMNGTVDVPTIPLFNLAATASGPVQTIVLNKIGNVTGTFQTEMLAMNLVGASPGGPFMVRESPTLPSTGTTTIAPLGGGMFHIDSFFDVFTELSLDGGQTWLPDSTGPHRVELQPFPEPSACVIAGLGAGGLCLRRRRTRRR